MEDRAQIIRTSTAPEQTAEVETSAPQIAFQFEETIICPGCNRPLQMMLQPVHTSIQVRCPRCTRQLTPLIRRAIRQHLESV